MSLTKLFSLLAVAVSVSALGTASGAAAASFPFPPKKGPDLYVTSVTSRGFVIRNIGSAPARASKVYVAAGRVGDTCDDVVRPVVLSVPALASGQPFDVHVRPSSTRRRVILDITGAVHETNEQNNDDAILPGELIVC